MYSPKYLNFDDYEKYYRNQIGGLHYFKGEKFQSGYGYFGRFLLRYAIPALKNIGKEAVKTGLKVITDVSRGINLKKALKTRLFFKFL
jgi:hypothetical protein